jgi:hypothetical protein
LLPKRLASSLEGEEEMKLRSAVALCATLVALVLAAPAQGHIGESATGSGVSQFSDGFAFSATGGPGDTGTGTMTLDQGIFGGTQSASVKCLLVSGDIAVIVGTVTNSTSAFYHVGWDMIFIVEDLGTPGAGVDSFYAFFNQDPTSCDEYASFLTSRNNPITAGEISVVGLTPEQDLALLIAELQSSPVGPGNSYLAKLQAIAGSLDGGNTQVACNQLAAFENEVRAQTGKKVAPTEAAALLRESTAITTRLGCP